MNASDSILRKELQEMEKISNKILKVEEKNASLATDLQYYSDQATNVENLLTQLESKIADLPEPDTIIYSNKVRKEKCLIFY